MAGKFLPLDEAARHLGVTSEEIQRFVDRKKLFPVRDGTTSKFKIDDLDRLAAEGLDESEPSGLSLELEPLDLEPEIVVPVPTPPPAVGEGTIELELGEAAAAANIEEIPLADSIAISSSAISSSGVAAGSAAAQAAPANDELAMTMLGTGEAIGLDALELDLDSIVGLSSPAADLPASVSKPAPAAGPDDSGTLAIDLSDIGGGSKASRGAGSNAAGSLVLGSDIDAAAMSGPITDAGAALSGALDSGLSLEDGDMAGSGVVLGPLGEEGIEDGGATALAGDEFDMVGMGDDDESASVVAVEPETGDSSFFATSEDESSDLTGGSGFTGDADLGAGIAADLGDLAAAAVVPDTTFNVWQIAGLVCCSLLLLTGGFVMFDLMRTLGSPEDLSLASPLLNSLSTVFKWRG